MSTEWRNENPFMPKIKTAEQARAYIKAGGVACVETKIEKVFRHRLIDLKIKIQRLNIYAGTDEVIFRALINSILIDCRAILLENPKRKRNATLQNVYRARRQDEKAAEVDDLLNKEVLPGKPFIKIIKDWVDKRIAHTDWLCDDDESKLLEDIEVTLFSNEMNNFFKILEELINDYEAMVKTYGENLRSQFEKTMEAMAGESSRLMRKID